MKFFHSTALSAGVVALLAASFVVVPAAPSIADTPVDVERMIDFAPGDFVDEARALPPELVEAVNRDLGISGEQYLAESAAAVRAPEVVESLTAVGVDVLGSRMDGTNLVVNIADAADEAVVASAGAAAEIGEPAPFDINDMVLSFSADIYGGQGYYYEAANNTAFRCSIGFNGFASSGAKEFLTAGHCTNTVRGGVWSLQMTAPDAAGSKDATLGYPVPGTTSVSTGGYDVGRISVPSAVNAVPSVLTWGGSTGAPLSSTPLKITGRSAATVGASVCKSGSTTGWTCGVVREVDYDANVQGSTVNSVVTTACTRPGDSGGSVVMGSVAVGVTSWSVDSDSSGTVSCGDSRYAAGAFPMDSAAGKASVAKIYGSSWTLATTVESPVVSTPTDRTKFDSIQGTVSGATSGSVVDAYLDGSSSYFARVSATSGSFVIPLRDVTAGAHKVILIHRSGSSSSASIRSDVTISDLSDRLFVQQVYRDFLNREATSTEQSMWMSKLAAGSTNTHGVATALSQSDEWISTVISGYYRDTLQREPDARGLAYWTSLARSGMPVSQIAAAFYSSAEYFRTVGESKNRTWVADLYDKLLLRTGETSGVNYWVSTIESGVARVTVAYSFYQSSETLGVRVNSIFQKLLHRTGSTSTVAYWSKVVGGQGDLVLAAAVAGSAEYYENAQASAS
ncbi:DUF4214 domain-containing protein [Salinibacterium sp. G-O1]|uniref:DUF4214 domain-containing protein n=1 Tax=Salinibacterium sp. G-O1 TaxID=3046208 RepID=UPI0024BA6F52|nr:DUF4214 domain-containing protein [Salinibacterium sp. G-O1]MDJ0336508.1 DUF4214 domain-containing protein [Salinibacterium sp. G-O1]